MTCYVCMICFNYVNNANLGMYCMVTGKVEHLTVIVSNNFILLLFLDLPYPTCDVCNGSSTSDCPCRCQAPRCSNCGVPSTSTYANDVNSYRHVAHVIAGFQPIVSATIRKDAKHV